MEDKEDKEHKSAPYAVGDGNALDVHNTSDSHDVNNVDARAYIDSHNVTNVYVDRTPEDLTINERKRKYRDVCNSLIHDGIIDKDVRNQLNEVVEKLSLGIDDARKIENEVKRLKSASLYLSGADQSMFDYIVAQLESDQPNIQDCFFKLEALAKRVEQEDVQFYYYLLLAAQEPATLVRFYENRDCDNYWQTYWAYFAYLRLGVHKKAEDILGILNNWSEYSGNVLLAQCAGILYDSLSHGIDSSAKCQVATMMENCLLSSHSLNSLKNVVIDLSKCPIQQTDEVTSRMPYLFKKIFDIDKFCRRNGGSIRSYNTGSSPTNVLHEDAIKNRVNSVEPPIQSQRMAAETNQESTTAPLYSKQWIYYIVAGLVVLFVFKQVAGSKDEESMDNVENTAMIAAIDSSSDNIDKGNNKSSKTNSNSKKTPQTQIVSEKGNMRKIDRPQTAVNNTVQRGTELNQHQTHTKAAQTSQTVDQTSVNQTSTQSATLLSASELVSKGKSSLRKFQDGKAYEYFLQASNMGDADASFYLGELFNNGGNDIERSYPRAFSYYQRAAKMGHVKAQYMLGMMYRTGHGCDKSMSDAKYWLKKSAAQGYSKAEEMLNKL